MLVAYGAADFYVSRQAENAAGLNLVEREHRAVRPWPEPGRDEDSVYFFAHDFDLGPPVITWREGCAVYGGRYNDWRIGPNPIRFGEWTLNNGTKILMSITAGVRSVIAMW